MSNLSRIQNQKTKFSKLFENKGKTHADSKGTYEGGEKLPKTLASSEGSLRYTSPWEVVCKGLLSFAPCGGAREVGGDSEQVRS